MISDTDVDELARLMLGQGLDLELGDGVLDAAAVDNCWSIGVWNSEYALRGQSITSRPVCTELVAVAYRHR